MTARRLDPDTPQAFYRYERFHDYSTHRRIKQTGSLKFRISICHGLLNADERASLVPRPER